MNFYIASSWKNETAVRLLTAALRELGQTVVSFVEHVTDREKSPGQDFAEWVWSDEGKLKFEYDTDGATSANMVIYIGPSGTDAWAEVGAAWAKGVPVLGLWAKGEPAGLMRRMVSWAKDVDDLLAMIKGRCSYAGPCQGRHDETQTQDGSDRRQAR